MADNIYTVAPNFPVGCLLSQLAGEMPSVWPADLFPMATIRRSGGAPGEVLTTGTINLTTQRALVGSENADALAHFQLHVPVVGAAGGILTADLTAGVYQGEMVYVSDEQRQGNTTSGVICYWDGTDRTWRRVRDDASVAVIP